MSRLDEDLYQGLKNYVEKHSHSAPIIPDDDISVGCVAALLGEIDRLRAEVESERKRLGDECDRIVLDWHDTVEEVKKNSAVDIERLGGQIDDMVAEVHKTRKSCYQSPGGCSDCGNPLVPTWVCEQYDCGGHDGDGDV